MHTYQAIHIGPKEENSYSRTEKGQQVITLFCCFGCYIFLRRFDVTRNPLPFLKHVASINL
jgi:hypothetical protein